MGPNDNVANVFPCHCLTLSIFSILCFFMIYLKHNATCNSFLEAQYKYLCFMLLVVMFVQF